MSFLEDWGRGTKLVEFNGKYRMWYTHVHPHFELCFCYDDIKQISIVNGVEYVYKYPSVILSSPFTLHSMSSVDEDTNKFGRYIFYFGESTLRNFNDYLMPMDILRQNIGLLFKLNVDEAEELKKIAEMYHKNKTEVENDRVLAMFINKLMALCPPERIEMVGATSFYIQDVLRYISENFMSGLDISVISKRFAVSRSKLDRDFKKFAGITVHSYVELCRLNQAKYLLEYRSDLSVSDIALMCGFKSENYFFPFFKKTVGKTPSEYRRKRD